MGALALEGLLAPVQGLTDRVLGFLPSIFAAALIFVVGWFVARLVQRIVSNLLAAAGIDRLSARVGLDSALGANTLSSLLGLVVYVLILVPVLISALNALQLEAITGPASQMLAQILDAIPGLFAGGLLFTLAFFVGKLVSGLVVNLLRGGEPVAMSTRAGEFVTLRDVVGEVGTDAARFIFLSRHYESPLDFDLELAKQKSNDNPVYYVQYVHARICSMIRKAAENGIGDIDYDETAVARLTEPEEILLLKTLSRFPEAVQSSAENLEPHRITFFLMNLASVFHTYYNKHRVLTDDPVLSRGRLYLVENLRGNDP